MLIEIEERLKYHDRPGDIALLSHSNTATIFAVKEHQDETFIAMEFVEGQPLDTLIKRGSPLKP